MITNEAYCDEERDYFYEERNMELIWPSLRDKRLKREREYREFAKRQSESDSDRWEREKKEQEEARQYKLRKEREEEQRKLNALNSAKYYDITKFNPFDKVLVRDSNDLPFQSKFFSHKRYILRDPYILYVTTDGLSYKCCKPVDKLCLKYPRFNGKFKLFQKIILYTKKDKFRRLGYFYEEANGKYQLAGSMDVVTYPYHVYAIPYENNEIWASKLEKTSPQYEELFDMYIKAQNLKFKRFERIMVRVSEDTKWYCSHFLKFNQDFGSDTDITVSTIEDSYKTFSEYAPFNKETKHLLGTDNNYEYLESFKLKNKRGEIHE